MDEVFTRDITGAIVMVTYVEIAKMIDHSLLKPTLTDQEIKEGCEIAVRLRCGCGNT